MERGQVRFHDVAYVETKVHHGGSRRRCDESQTSSGKSKRLLTSSPTNDELTIAAELREGKSEVVCEQGKLIKVSKDKKGVITRDVLTKQWTDWVDYWAVDFDYESRKEIIKVAKNLGVEGALPGTASVAEFIDFEERWTGAYIFENEWQSFRTRQERKLELTTASHTYPKAGRYVIAVKVVDIFGNDTMTIVPVTVG